MHPLAPVAPTPAVLGKTRISGGRSNNGVISAGATIMLAAGKAHATAALATTIK
jgi:hypothetical protein